MMYLSVALFLGPDKESEKMNKTVVFKDSNRTTAYPFEKMTLVVTKKDSGGVRLRLIQHGFTKELPGSKTDFFLDADEAVELFNLIG